MSVVARLFAGCLIFVVVAIFVAGGVVYGMFRFSDAEPVQGAWSQPLDGAGALAANIEVNSGDVTVADSLPAAPVVANGTAFETEYVAGSSTPVDRGWEVVDGTGTVRLGSGSTRPPAAFLGWLQSPEQARWDVGLNPNVPVDLTANIAFGSARLDLTGLAVSRLDLNVAIGSADVVLGAAGAATGSSRIRVGVGDVQLAVPEDVPVSIRVSAGAGGVDAGDAFLYDGMTYTNKAWQTRPDLTSGVELVIEAGTGYVTLSSLTTVTGPATAVSSDPLPVASPSAPSSPPPVANPSALAPVDSPSRQPSPPPVDSLPEDRRP